MSLDSLTQQQEEVGYGPGFYFIMFVTFKGGKACKSLRLKNVSKDEKVSCHKL